MKLPKLQPHYDPVTLNLRMQQQNNGKCCFLTYEAFCLLLKLEAPNHHNRTTTAYINTLFCLEILELPTTIEDDLPLRPSKINILPIENCIQCQLWRNQWGWKGLQPPPKSSHNRTFNHKVKAFKGVFGLDQ